VITADQFIAGARSMVGVPWLHQGRSRSGVDCIGLITSSAESAGLDVAELINALGVADTRDYGRTPTEKLIATLERYCEKSATPVPGCMILIQFPSEKLPRHFGLYTDTGTMIHANGKLGRVVENGYRGLWVKWTHSYWLAQGVDYGV